MDLVIVGSVALDTIKTPFGSVKEGLGGSATFSACSACNFAPVRLVAVVGNDFPARHRAFLSRRANLEGLEKIKGRTFRWTGKYGQDLDNAQTLKTELGVFGTFKPVLPEKARNCKLAFLANIDPTIQLEVLSQLKKPKFVAADTMNFWIGGKLRQLKEVIGKVDLLLINEGEARQLTGISNVIKAGRALVAMGPKYVIVKKGAHGAVLIKDTALFTVPAFPLDVVVDPTGAGDSFAGGLMGYLAGLGRVTWNHLKLGAVYGTVMASFAVQSMGQKALVRADKAAIRTRMNLIRNITKIPPGK